LKININSERELNILISKLEAGTFKLDLIDLNGIVLKTKEFEFFENTQINLNFYIGNIPSGVYFIKISNLKINKVKKFLIY
jgi:hypothetical protein